jgi:hypothetical protein
MRSVRNFEFDCVFEAFFADVKAILGSRGLEHGSKKV